MEGTGWHYSHLERKQVFGYQIFGTHISTGNTALCYELRRCCPENGSKIDMAVQLLDHLPETNVPVIALMDSWYTCQRLWDKAMEKGSTSRRSMALAERTIKDLRPKYILCSLNIASIF